MDDNKITVETLKIEETTLELYYQNALVKPESFIQTLFSKTVEKPSRETIKSWSILSEIEKMNLFSSLESLESIPNLTSELLTSNNKSGLLVKYHSMIQNIYENQLYLSFYHDKTVNRNVINKYHEYDFKSIQKNEMDENLMDEDHNMENKTLLERLVLNCVQIPGKINSIRDMKVLVYEYDNENIKINEERLFIGVAYMIMGRIELHSWFNIKDYSKLIYPGVPLDCVNLYDIYRYSNNMKLESSENSLSKLYLSQKERMNLDFKETRSKLKSVFTEIFGGDELLSEYLLMFLSSRVFSRYSTIVTGKLCLNISKLKLEKDLQTLEISPSNKFNISSVDASLKKLFGSICNQSLFFSSSVKNLNDIPFKSFFDVNKDELRQGYLQVVDNTYLVLDERVIEAGQLNENGLNNLQALANLIEGQFMHYEYPYTKVEINQDVKILILSESKPLISKNAPSMTEVPLVRCHPFNLGVLDSLNEEDVENFKKFMFLIQHPYLKFTIENEISEKIQKDFLSERSKDPEYSPDNLDKNLNLSKLFAISNGATKLLFEDYNKVKELESYRKERLLDGENKSNK